MTDYNSNVEPLRSEQIPEVIKLMASTFMEDPSMEFILPNPVTRQHWLEKFMHALLQIVMNEGQVFCVSQTGVVGVILTTPPGKYPISFLKIVKAMGDILWKISISFTYRLLTLSNFIERIHNQIQRGPHWYIFILATHPVEGRFAGKALFEYIFSRAKEDQVPVYCESFKKGNIPLFTRQYDFKIIQETTVGKNGPKMWALVRNP